MVGNTPEKFKLKENPNILAEYRAVEDKTVLSVAIQGTGYNDWACYIKGVKGENHREEAESVASHGAKCSKELAELLFPTWAQHFKYRE